MNKPAMRIVVRTLYAIYGRKDPGDTIVDAAVDAVPESADDAFVTYAKDAISGLERLPANVGRWLSRVVYPQYVADRIVANGGSQCGIDGCPDCGGTGWHNVWRPDAQPGTEPTAIPCVCNRIVDAWCTSKPYKWTRQNLQAAGWTFTAPAVPAGRAISRDRLVRKRGEHASH